MKKKFNIVKEAKRSARDVIGHPSKGKKTGAHVDRVKENNKNKCREPVEVATEYVDELPPPTVNPYRHNWSGWPGAWCMDCGIEDQLEVCMADCPYSPYPVPPGEPEIPPCPIHVNVPCLHQGEGLFNPYLKKDK